MKLKLPLKALSLLKYVLTFTGEKEITGKGEEVDATRRLSGEESSQRNHFNKSFKPLEEESVKKLNELLKVHNEKVEAKKKTFKEANAKLETEKDEDYEKRINKMLDTDVELIESAKDSNEKINSSYNEELEMTLTDKTLEVVKKYFKEFGEGTGFRPGDDEAVEMIEKAL